VFEPADIAALAVHLMINTAVTGATVDIDGGQRLVQEAGDHARREPCRTQGPRLVRDHDFYRTDGTWFHLPRQEALTMEYLVEMTTHVPEGTAESAVEDVRTREAARSRELAAAGHLLRLWRR
jgi:hypothetical protein